MKPRGWCGSKGCGCCGSQNARPRTTDEHAAIRDQERNS
jgi:hypothetical protein